MASEPIFADVPAWPEANPRAVLGGNKPPLEEIIPAEFRQALVADKPDFLTRLDQLLGKVNPDPEKPEDLGSVHRARCEDEETLGRCGELIDALRRAEQHVGAVHKAVKEPYLQGGRLVDAQKNVLVARINAGQGMVLELQNTFLREQRDKERKAQQAIEAERAKLEELARENDIEAALPPPPPPAPSFVGVGGAPRKLVRSDGGSTVSAKVEWLSQVEDYAKAFKVVKTDAKVREAIDAAIQRRVKAGDRTIPGVRIWDDVKANNR